MFSDHDREVLRGLARRVAAIAALPVMADRRQLWRRHNALDAVRPMVLIFPEGAWCELLPGDALACEDPHARNMEHGLRQRIYGYEHFASDNVVEADWPVHKVIRSTGWGLEPQRVASTAQRGAWAFDPVINQPSDLNKLRWPDVWVDEEATQRNWDTAQELFGDILEVKMVGVTHVSFHLYNQYTALRGLEQVFMDMVCEPNWLHDAMAFLTEGHQRLIQQYVDLDLLSPNNDNTYHSTGGNGYTDELAPGADGKVKLSEMWASAESQELEPVSPAMHAEFATAYEKKLLEPFGLNGYGCCEGLHHKLEDVTTIPSIRRISMSPFANVDVAAPLVGDRYIFSWKPQPSHLVGEFNPELIRGYLQHTLDVCRGGVLEIILKDTHTCQNHPERFDQWTRICRELVDRAAAGWR
jgi:hypothetical protein